MEYFQLSNNNKNVVEQTTRTEELFARLHTTISDHETAPFIIYLGEEFSGDAHPDWSFAWGEMWQQYLSYEVIPEESGMRDTVIDGEFCYFFQPQAKLWKSGDDTYTLRIEMYCEEPNHDVEQEWDLTEMEAVAWLQEVGHLKLYDVSAKPI